MFSINLVSQVASRSSRTDILYGCHLLLDVYIILSIYVPSTHAYTHVLCVSLDLPTETG